MNSLAMELSIAIEWGKIRESLGGGNSSMFYVHPYLAG